MNVKTEKPNSSRFDKKSMPQLESQTGLKDLLVAAPLEGIELTREPERDHMPSNRR